MKIVNFIKKSATTSRLFKQFCKEMDRDHETLLHTKQEITKHLQLLENEFEKYFSDLEEGSDVFPRNPFSVMIDIATIPEEVQDKLLELRNDSAGREIFMTKSLSQFWSFMLTSYPKLSTEALCVIVPFTSTYFCESGFSALMHIKSKACNQLDVEDGMRIAISKTQPRILRLACNMQQQKLHYNSST